jgi:hypothetical protein
VHTTTAVEQQLADRALRALESAYRWLGERGWPLPYPDGGHGGTPGFDLYMTGAAHGAAAFPELSIAWTDLDAATTFALIGGESEASDALEGCIFSALAQAGLLAADPAEAAAPRRAVATLVSFIATSSVGCNDALVAAQGAPHLGAVGDRPEQVALLTSWLSLIALRHDGGSGRFILDCWQLARQRSEHRAFLNALPDFWQALSAALDKAGESLESSAAELAVWRFAPRAAHSGTPPPAPPVHVASESSIEALPRHLDSTHPLRSYASSYAIVTTEGTSQDAQVRAWLRGEAGARWLLTAVRLGADDRELGRVSAPARTTPDSFLPVDLTPETHRVLFVVTRLPLQRPGPQTDSDDDAGGFRLILDRR